MHLKSEILQMPNHIDEHKINALLEEEIHKNNKIWVVLDDDPTGIQTVHDLNVYTTWDKESLQKAFETEKRMFFVLTNSRGFTPEETVNVHRKLAKNISEIAAKCGKEFQLISRSDSTLRGHYPLEPSILREVIEDASEKKIDGEILCPFFYEGGRFTINNIHYVQYGEDLVPAAETEFAKDKSFTYTSSDMTEYIEEKTKGEFKKEDVLTIPLDLVNKMDIDGITAILSKAENFQKIVINAINYLGLKVVCIAIYRAMANGKTFMFRTAASIVKVLGGVQDVPLLSKEKLIRHNNGHGGLIIVGSYTQKTTKQLEQLLKIPDVVALELNSDLALEATGLEQEVARVLQKEEQLLNDGKTTVVYTKRTQLSVEGETPDELLQRSVRISRAVSDLVAKLSVEPLFVIAKGGITSYDIGVNALQVKQAVALGQILPGVPVWNTGVDSKFPNMPYVIFPGNVGDEESLKKAAEVLLF